MLTKEQIEKLKDAGYNDMQIGVFDKTRTSAIQSKPSYGERVKTAFKSGIDYAKQGLEEGNQGTPMERFKNPVKGFESAMKVGSGAINAAFSPLTAAVEPVIKPTVGVGINYVADKISDSPAVQKFATSKAGETTSRIAEDVSNVANIAGTVAGFKATPPVAKVTSDITKTFAKGTTQATKEAIRPVVQATRNVASPLIEEAKRLPSRLKTNIAHKQAIQESINKLPTRVAREAAQDGLDVADVQALYNIPKAQTSKLKALADVTKRFAEGKTKTNPIEIVGKPIVSRLKELELQRVKVGSKLGELSSKLGTISREELFPTVFQRLKKVPGLEGLSVDDAGRLNFKNTVLATAETAADRKAIQSIFTEAIKWGNGKNKHLLRQELFESLGGKKRSTLNLTATQERAYDAIRQGLSDVLESKSVGYKNLSSQYRQLITPLREMRRLIKVSGEVSDDILDMSAGLLARRLTSAAQSNPQIRAILSAMDRATKKAGQTRLSVETLQDFYNIIEKYYDIAPKTGFQAQVRQGVEKAATGPINYLGEKIKGLAGETPAVRQQALEKILEEIFKIE